MDEKNETIHIKDEYILSINEVCRLCLEKKENMGCLTENNIPEMLFECTAIELTANDELFNLICSQCISQLQSWYSFKKEVVSSFQIGSQLVEQYFKEQECFRWEDAAEEVDTEKEVCKVEYINNDFPSDEVQSAIYLPPNYREENEEKVDDCEQSKEVFSNKVVSCSKENHEGDKKATANAAQKKFSCSYCDKSYVRRTKLNEHIRLHTGEKPYKCHLCRKMFRTQPSFRNHLKEAHEVEKPFQCFECQQNFYLETELELHILSHSGQKPVACISCDKTFTSTFALNGHLKVHTSALNEDEALKCGKCSKLFARAALLNKHIKIHHEEQLNAFLCTICGSTFKTKRSLRGHMDFRHIRNKRYKCTECDAAYIAKNQLDSHMRKHTGERRRIIVNCELCGKGCANKTELNVHMRFHTGERPFKCDLCDRRFIIKGNLTTHRRLHTGEKPFSCRFCHKGFRETSSLKVHERVHTGERPYICVHCGKSFYKRYNLSVHLRVHR